MDLTQFISWEVLGTYGGALIMVGLLTQLIKGHGFVKKIPTQLLTYILSVIVLVLAEVFTGAIEIGAIVQTLFNAVIISIASNGGYNLIQRATGAEAHSDGNLLIDSSNPEKDIYRLDLGNNLEVLAEQKAITLTVKRDQNLQG